MKSKKSKKAPRNQYSVGFNGTPIVPKRGSGRNVTHGATVREAI